MKKYGYSVLVTALLLLFATLVNANNLSGKTQLSADQQLMAARDRAEDIGFSNITIQNKTGAPVTAYGLYINQLAFTDSKTTCAGATLLYPGAGGTPNQAGGAYVTAIPFTPNQKLPLGQNYLYNMIYTAIYYNNQPSCAGTCSPCTLPGCAWFTDPVPYNWCIYMGVLGPESGNTTSAKVPPYGFPTTDSGYNYNMVTQYEYIGPISCDDQTQTCSVSTAQNVAFPQ